MNEKVKSEHYWFCLNCNTPTGVNFLLVKGRSKSEPTESFTICNECGSDMVEVRYRDFTKESQGEFELMD